MEEVDVEVEFDGSVDDIDVVVEVDIIAINVVGRGKRKIYDEGVDLRKKKLLC